MNDKIKGKEKIAYAFANMGNIPVTMIVSSFLLIFYTNVVGISPAACATLFLIARIFDAVNDPLIGYLIDRAPRTKLGRFRTVLIVGSILCGLNYLLLWYGPLMIPVGKLAIAYISYFLLGILFPVMDISLNSLLPVMTNDEKERGTLSSIKGVVYTLTGLVLGIIAPMIIGEVSEAHGYLVLIAIVVAMIIGLSVIGALGVKERVEFEDENKYGIKELFRILTYRPVWSLFIANLLFGVANYSIMAVNAYYYTYILGNFEMYGLASLISIVGMIPGIIISAKIAEKLGKKNAYIAGLMCFGILPLIRLLGTANVPIVFASVIASNFGMGLLTPYMYSIQADNTDYVEWKSGYHAEAAVASLASFVSKFSMGIGGAIPGYLLAFVGFNEKAAVQSAATNEMLIFCAVILPAIVSVVVAVIFGVFYPLTKSKLEDMGAELKKQR
ncbi:MAG: MFS transporter [Eubacteriales bacterium]|nr:MFS transporter [Eubacteriales bacterium]